MAIDSEAKAGRTSPPGLIIFSISLLYFMICGLLSFGMGATTVFFCLLILVIFAMCAGECFSMHQSFPILAMLGLVSFLFAGYVGTVNFRANYALYQDAEAGRDYKDVSPVEKASTYSDAGTITFKDATLDTFSALGLSDGTSVYCAAPIMSMAQSTSHGESAVPVQYWAVGKDCCRRRQDFMCDDANLPSVKGGIVISEPHAQPWGKFLAPVAALAPATQWTHFYQAAESAAALYGLRMADTPVLLRWVKDPKEVKEMWMSRALAVWLITSAVQFCIVLVAWMMVHYYYKERMMRQAGILQAPQPQSMQSKTLDRSGTMRDPFLLGNPNPM